MDQQLMDQQMDQQLDQLMDQMDKVLIADNIKHMKLINETFENLFIMTT